MFASLLSRSSAPRAAALRHIPLTRPSNPRWVSTSTSGSQPPEKQLAEKEIEDLLKNYNPQVMSDTEVVAGPGTPIPLNVELNYYEPIRLPIQYGDLVCELQFRSYTTEMLDFFCNFVLRAAFYLGIPARGPKYLPTKRERWTVIRSPFAMAKSKENFQRLTHKRGIKLYDANPDAVDALLAVLQKHQIPGVGMKANTYSFESLDIGKQLSEVKLETADENVAPPKYIHFGNSNNKLVAQRVQELLEDPLFKRHLEAESGSAEAEAEAEKKPEEEKAEAPAEENSEGKQ